MRIGVVADIHGNLVALEAVLAALAAEGIDRLVCLGDVAAGPQPTAVVDRLRQTGCPVVMGNADAELLAPPSAAAGLDEDASRFADIARWRAARLSAAQRETIRAYPPTVTVPLADDRVLLACHGSPRSFDDPVLATTPDAALDPMLAGVRAAILAGGHSHVQLLRRHRDLLLLNPGSVGLPMDRVPPAAPIRNPPWAEYAVVTAADGRLGLDLRRVPFDVDAFVAAALASGMPHAAWYTADWLH
jgi:predicted phosphodiesterase